MLRRPVVWITIVATIFVTVVWYFAWMSPQGSKLSNENLQITSLQGHLTALQATLATDKLNEANLTQYTHLLGIFSIAVPPTPEAAQLTTEIAALADSTDVNITSLTIPPTSTSSSSTPGVVSDLSEISIGIDMTCKWSQCLKFVGGIYTYPRLITIQSFAPTPAGNSNGAGPTIDVINPSKNQEYTIVMNGTAYFSPVISGQVLPTTTVAP